MYEFRLAGDTAALIAEQRASVLSQQTCIHNNMYLSYCILIYIIILISVLRFSIIITFHFVFTVA